MSNANLPIKLVNGVPEVLNFGEVYHAVPLIPSNFSVREFSAQSTNSSTIAIDCSPPSETTVISPMVKKNIQFAVSVTMVNTTGGNRFGTAGLTTGALAAAAVHPIVPRANPLDKVINTETMVINGSSFSTPLNDYEAAFCRVASSLDDKIGAMTPSMLDEVHLYSEANNSFRDVFGKYEDSVLQESRQAFSGNDYALSDAELNDTGLILGDGTPKILTFYINVSEYVKISPFYYQKKGLVGIRSMRYTITFGDLMRAVCAQRLTAVSTNVNITNVSVAISAASISLMCYNHNLLTNIPLSISYPHQEQYVVKTTAGSDTLAGASATIQGTTINLQSVPRRLIIWVQEQTSDMLGYANIVKTDTLKAGITNLSIGFDNEPTLLSNVSQSDLYNLSRTNGYTETFTQFSKKCGSVIVLNMDNLGLRAGLAPSVNYNPLLTVKATFKNLSDVTKRFELKCCVIFEGMVTNEGGKWTAKTAILDSGDVLTIQQDKEAYEVVLGNKYDNSFGGFNPLAILAALPSIFRGVRGAVQTVGPAVLKGADFLEKIGAAKPKKGKGGIIAGSRITKDELGRYM